MSREGERLDHPTRDLPGGTLVGGDLRLRIFRTPSGELARTVGERVPRWIQRLYESYGVDLADPPLSASMEAVAEGLKHRLEGIALVLRKAEARGWKAVVEDDLLVIYTGIGGEEVQAQLEEDGVLTLVQEFSHADPAVAGEGR
jgi:hypothetical protein